jgi:hypothetical protein
LPRNRSQTEFPGIVEDRKTKTRDRVPPFRYIENWFTGGAELLSAQNPLQPAQAAIS